MDPRQPAPIPDREWDEPATVAALDQRDAGGLLRLARKYGASQHYLSARAMYVTGESLTQNQISLVATGKSRVEKLEVWERIAAAMDLPDRARVRLGLAPKVYRPGGGAGGHDPAPADIETIRRPLTALRSQRTVHESGVEEGGVPLLSGIFTPDDEERLTRVVEEPRRVDAATVEYFRQLLDAHTRADRSLTPADLITALTPAYETLGRFRRAARPPVRRDLHTLASRYAQLIGRMHYEAGNLTAANSWSDQALLAAHEAEDEQLVAYTLARRASLVGATGDLGQVVDLALAARERVSFPAHLDAMARRHEAQGHAMAGDADLCFRRLNEAAELLVHGSDGAATPYASGFSLGFHDVQAAGCYLELGRSADAADILERELPNFRADYVKAHNLARLAQAYAGMHERDRAAETARSALALARQTGSGRARQALRRIHGDLAVWWD
jgi:tetratricopeptide (TPR) repeat protein